DHGHVVALDLAAIESANTGRPHRRKERIRRLRRGRVGRSDASRAANDQCFVSLTSEMGVGPNTYLEWQPQDFPPSVSVAD
ncbi:hypothetical protein ABZ494_16775, partial [Nocardia amamiensis]